MSPDDLILVSIDDHVVEPPDMFLNHVPAKYKPEAPDRRHRRQGRRPVDVSGPAAGRQRAQRRGVLAGRGVGSRPRRLRRDAPGVYDVHERVRDMNRNGILASMCFPTFTGFSARHLNMHREDVDAGDGVGLQRLAHRRVGRQSTRTGSSRSRCCRRGIPRPWCARDPPGRRQGLPRGHHAGTAPPGRPSELPRRGLLGSGVPDAVRGERGDVPAHRHRLRRDQHGARTRRSTT